MGGWEVSSGRGVEVHNGNVVTAPKRGKRVIELDSHGDNSNSAIQQRVYLCPGKHVVRFLYYPRTKRQGDNTISLRLNGIELSHANKVHDGKWHQIRGSFYIKKPGYFDLEIAAEGKENTRGLGGSRQASSQKAKGRSRHLTSCTR